MPEDLVKNVESFRRIHASVEVVENCEYAKLWESGLDSSDVGSKIIRSFFYRLYLIIYKPFRPIGKSIQQVVFLHYINGFFQPVVFKVNNKWQHFLPVELRLEAPFDKLFRRFDDIAPSPGFIMAPPSPPVEADLSDLSDVRNATPSLYSDPFFGALVPRAAYRIQSVPGDGNCFFYALSLSALQIDDLNGVPRPVPQSIKDEMLRLRSGAARDIYYHPTYLEEMYIRDLNKTLPLRNTDTFSWSTDNALPSLSFGIAKK